MINSSIWKFNNPEFTKHFRHVDTSKPEKGDIIACFRAIAEIVDGADKKDLIFVCQQPNSAQAAAQMMRKVFNSAEHDVWGIPRMITEDLVNGMTEKEVEEKIYSYSLELFFYTKPQYLPPKDDPDSKYWSLIKICNLEDYLKINIKDESGLE